MGSVNNFSPIQHDASISLSFAQKAEAKITAFAGHIFSLVPPNPKNILERIADCLKDCFKSYVDMRDRVVNATNLAKTFGTTGDEHELRYASKTFQSHKEDLEKNTFMVKQGTLAKLFLKILLNTADTVMKENQPLTKKQFDAVSLNSKIFPEEVKNTPEDINSSIGQLQEAHDLAIGAKLKGEIKEKIDTLTAKLTHLEKQREPAKELNSTLHDVRTSLKENDGNLLQHLRSLQTSLDKAKGTDENILNPEERMQFKMNLAESEKILTKYKKRLDEFNSIKPMVHGNFSSFYCYDNPTSKLTAAFNEKALENESPEYPDFVADLKKGEQLYLKGGNLDDLKDHYVKIFENYIGNNRINTDPQTKKMISSMITDLKYISNTESSKVNANYINELNNKLLGTVNYEMFEIYTHVVSEKPDLIKETFERARRNAISSDSRPS